MSQKFECLLFNHCAPTLCNIKSSNLISLKKDEYPNILSLIDELNKNFNPKLYFKILKISSNNILVLVYKYKKLKDTIFKKDNLEFLMRLGYPIHQDLDLYLDYLMERFNLNQDFPHEIGIFLDYPLEDTIEFIKGNKHELYTGYWKVYSNLEFKLKIFDLYNASKAYCKMLFSKGYHIESLID